MVARRPNQHGSRTAAEDPQPAPLSEPVPRGADLGISAALLADVAHVARNHITIIRSYLEMLHSETGDTLDDDQLCFLGAAYDNVLLLGSLVEDLVLIGALETGIAEIELEVFTPGAVLDTLLDELSPDARSEGVTLGCRLDPEAGLVRADRAMLGDAVRRLLDNAIRFTPSGGTVTASVRAEEDRIAIVIADSGVGMTGDELERAFELMTQLHRTPGVPRRGHGLGLPVVRQIVTALGGELDATSEVGVGTTFAIRLPVVAAAEAP